MDANSPAEAPAPTPRSPSAVDRVGVSRANALDRIARAAIVRGLDRLTDARVVLRDRTLGDAAGGPEDAAVRLAVTIRDPRAYRRIAGGGSIGAAEAYIDGQWTTDDLPALLRLFARNLGANDAMEGGVARLLGATRRLTHTLRSNSRRGSRRNIGAHYDLSNAFFASFLDETMTYSAGYFERPDATMAEASIAKLDRLCRKLHLGPDDHLLEIGTGWGSLALHAAGRYGCRVTTTTISREQHTLAKTRVRDAGLADRVDVRLDDYRELDGVYDKIVSIEMIEAVGHRNLGRFFEACGNRLKPDGLLAIQAITMPDHRYRQYLRAVDFIQRCVFPGSCLTSISAMTAAAGTASDLRLIDLDDMTPHYAQTLRHWRTSFRAARAAVVDLGFSESFLRLWEYYLCYCLAGFEEHLAGSVQTVFARPGWRPEPIR
ncbi:MAG: class I SAM-dependent methyltransferase [Phycisphaerales bacterium]|nr:cyclopropane-fatty-acyl-phospholipid synthase family protein [Phycisphaerae bacterium]NNF41693.1 class I SAM-dependent methyltransferase [Phycisphaerales bacterium]NNM26171.1 class I SAM-dependent methyltransferase [Phycisphaerales bacterium]